MLTEIQKKILKQVVESFEENNIHFQITGGLAAIIYGAKRSLFDIDIDVLKKDIPKISQLFVKYITQSHHRNQGKYFDNWTMVLEIDGVLVDIGQAEDCYMFGEDGKKIEMGTDLSHPTMVKFESMNLPVEPKDELVYYKKVLGRETDLIDIEQMAKNEEKAS